MPSRTEIIRKTNANARLQLLQLVELYERRVAKVFEDYSNLVITAVDKAEKEGKIPIGSTLTSPANHCASGHS